MQYKLKSFAYYTSSIFFKLVSNFFKNKLIMSYSLSNEDERINFRYPYMSIPSVDYLISLSKENNYLTLFEFGSGSSTLFFESNFQNVTSIENSKIWANKLLSKVSDKTNLVFVEYSNKVQNDEKYSKSINQFGTFDVIIIDGRDRVKCIKNSINHISSQGLIVLDNSLRRRYKEGIKFLIQEGYKETHFYGWSTYFPLPTRTTFFQKNIN